MRATIARLLVSAAGSASMAGQVLLDLALGLDDEAQVRAIADHARRDADRERAGVPQRVEQRRAIAKLLEPRRGPCEVVLLVARRCGEARLEVGIARDERLRGVERLRAHLAGVVDAHEACSVAAVASASDGGGRCAPGIGRAGSATPASVRSARSAGDQRCDGR
jgi:hypothetical protein